MNVRYIFNSDGKYVAFIQGDNLYSPDTEWLGFVRNSDDVYRSDGSYMGKLLADDRIVRMSAETPRRPVNAPSKPFKPFRPFAPFARLRMLPLPPGWEDVFENGAPGTLTSRDTTAFRDLVGSDLIGGDGTFLGTVSNKKLDPSSIRNQFGEYGSRYSAKSILNPYSKYGSKYSELSPFNKHANRAPTFVRNRKNLGVLTINQHVANRIDPEKFFLWLERL